MGFLTDIAEIAGLLFVAYMAGWLAGYLAHRLAARTPQLETAAAAREPATGQGQASDALVKAPIVVPVTTTPPPQVLAAATAIEPIKATAVPDADEAAPRPDPAPAPAPAISALDTLKSLSTAMPLMPPAEPPAAAEAQPVISDGIVPGSIAGPPEVTESMEPAATAEIVEPAIAIEPAIAVEPAIAAGPATVASPVEPTPPSTAGAAEPVLAVSPAVVEEVEDIPAPVKPEIRLAPATRAGEVAARPIEQPRPPAPVVASPPMPTSAPGMPWAGAINGHEAQKYAPEADPEMGEVAVATDSGDPIDEPGAALDVALLSTIADQLKLGPTTPAADDVDVLVAAVELPAPLASSPPEVAAREPLPITLAPEYPAPPPEPSAPPPEAELITPPPATAAEPPPVPVRRPALEEDAAMRAIEGGWSRRDVRALGDAPEMTDVSAAVSAAQVAVEQVLARNGVDAAEPESRAQASFGKPAGLPQPRDGRRDSLKRIDGLGPLDEVTLNNLGIYHFDQIAKWTEREVLWLENHAFAVGRIAREDWQDQARELIAERDATRALR